MLDRGANNYNEVLSIAASQGHLNMVELMLSHGANDFNRSMEVASRRDHQNIVELIRERMNPA